MNHVKYYRCCILRKFGVHENVKSHANRFRREESWALSEHKESLLIFFSCRIKDL